MSVESPRRIHRRRSSAGDDDDNALVVVTPPVDFPSIPMGPPPSRTRVQSTPHRGHQRNQSISGLPLNISGNPGLNLPPSSAGPYRTSFHASPVSPFRNNFPHNHSRTRSVSSPYSPSLPSPLSTSTSFADQMNDSIPTSQSAPSNSTRDADGNLKPPISPHTRRHSRIHSRNLSVFFPRPGSVSEATIDEDGVQELEIRPTLGAGFSFGTTPPPEEMPMPSANESGGITPSSSASRRGHHHKHSVSHTFFSFLEPRGTDSQTLVTQPTPTPISPWMPISPFPSDASLSSVPGKTEPPLLRDQRQAQPRAVYLATATGQFLLGATLWVQGQQCGSLSVTALGYWAVFDAIGVAIPHLRFHVSKPYATARTLPVLLFAQSVYLMFSAVYVCKEALEHLLLSADAGDGHHHHAGDEVAGILFPLITTFSTFCALAGTAFILDSHARLVSLAGNRIPPLRYLLSSKPAASASLLRPEPTAPLARALSNPYSATPLLIALGILGTALVVPPGEHRPVDLALAGAASAATFSAAYRACIVLGAVLLQTAPARGLRSGRMEAFLRAMRDVERHPQVLHLPAPHIWQLAADGGLEDGDGMVVTLEVHVSPTLGDDDVLVLTRWVRDRVATALGMGGSSGQAEVTVGVVRG